VKTLLRASAIVLAILATSQFAAAQQDQQPPAAGQQNFGPRVKPAQQQPGQQPPAEGGQDPMAQTETVAKHGAWQIQCGMAPAAKDQPPKKQCGMVQVTKSEKNEKIGLSLIIIKAKQGDKEVTMMRVMAPIGVFLPTGVALEIDKAPVGRVPFTRCRPQLCEAIAEASAPTLAKMKKGGAANFIIYEAPGLGIPMKISLDGFAAAIDELDKQQQ
jgi:invasion protein IalB